MFYYDEIVKGKTSEEILARAGGGQSSVVQGPEGEYLRVAAQIRMAEQQIASQGKLAKDLAFELSALTASINRASADSGALGRKVVLLTVCLVAVGLIQALAVAWPYLAYWWQHR